MQIIPMRDLKDTVKIERLCKEENGPVFITKNGYGRLVVMDIDYYENSLKKISKANMIAEGLEDLVFNNAEDGDRAVSDIKIKYGI